MITPKLGGGLPEINSTRYAKTGLNDPSIKEDNSKIRLMNVISTFKNSALESSKIGYKEEIQRNHNIALNKNTVPNQIKFNTLNIVSTSEKQGTNKNKTQYNIAQKFMDNSQKVDNKTLSTSHRPNSPIIEMYKTENDNFSPFSWEKIHDKIHHIIREQEMRTTLRESESLKK